MVQLVGQRRQRPAAGRAEHDFPHQVTGQLLRQHAARRAQHVGRRLPRSREAHIIQNSQLLCYPRLKYLQQRRLPGQRRIRHRLAEHLAYHRRQLTDLSTACTGQLVSCELDSGRGRLAKGPLLLTAEHYRGQFLTTGIGEQADQPRSKVIRDEHHASSLSRHGHPHHSARSQGSSSGYLHSSPAREAWSAAVTRPRP
jgi:hypothetical protein